MSGGRINWFPGHMNKARREIAKAMPKVDLVMEVLDARIPGSSSNPLVPELRGETPFLKILNKADLADPGATGAWLRHLENEPGVRAVSVQKDKIKEVKGLVSLAREMLPERRRGRSRRRRVRVRHGQPPRASRFRRRRPWPSRCGAGRRGDRR